jgi:putative DNA primase/helicase
MLSANLHNIPAELKALKQFLNWGVELGGGDNNPKRPYSPITRQPYDWTNPDKWGTFEQAYQGVLDGWALGVSFAFGGNSGVIGVDLDNCFKGGKLIPEAEDVVKRLNSFTERSQSGKGLHVYVFASGVDSIITKTSIDFPGYPKAEKRHLEVYVSGAHFCMTGVRFDG